MSTHNGSLLGSATSQPAVGAAAGYARMHAGFEDPGVMSLDRQRIEASMAAKIAGNYGDEVTAVLARSAGGLQLLPSQAYGNGWLRVQHRGRDLLTLPAKGDPYEEIYKLRGKWYALFPNDAWLNPAHLTDDNGGSAWDNTFELLDVARQFHRDLADTYHPYTYAHYGADSTKRAFGNVTWQISPRCNDVSRWQTWSVVANNRQGHLTFGSTVTATLDPPEEPGDQTVPLRSADAQLRSGRCKAVFRQTGYDHQGSYRSETVLASTLFSILRIAQRVQAP